MINPNFSTFQTVHLLRAKQAFSKEDRNLLPHLKVIKINTTLKHLHKN